MAMMICIHNYTLKAGVSGAEFEARIAEAEARGLLKLPGLVRHHFLRGVKGTRKDSYAAVWVYESREAWEKLWGPADRPLTKAHYPANWIAWEDEVLAPLLDQDPDRIDFTSYECL